MGNIYKQHYVVVHCFPDPTACPNGDADCTDANFVCDTGGTVTCVCDSGYTLDNAVCVAGT